MSLFGRIGREIKAADGLTWGQIETIWGAMLGGAPSRSGPVVNWLTALRVAAVLACTRRIVEAVATVPNKLYRNVPDTNRRREATEHPLFDLLGSGPNEWQDSLQFRDCLALHCVLASNAYAFVNRIRGAILEMIPLRPDRVTPRQLPDYSLVYRVIAPDGTWEDVPAASMLHIRGMSWDGFRGIDTVRLAREAIGLSLASEQTHAMLHAHGARPSGMLSVDGKLDEKGLVRLAAWVRKQYGGLDNTSRVMVMDSAAKFVPFDMKGLDSQHIALRQHEVEEVCRFIGVLPMVIGHPAEMAARAAVDSINTLHLVHTVRPWHRRFERAMDRQLLTSEERKSGLYTKLVDGEFLRATAKDRAAYNQVALGGPNNPGWATQNEVRGWDDMDAMDGGDALFVPTNMVPADQIGQTVPTTEPTDPGN